MASCMRLAGISRRSFHLVQCRKFTSTTAWRNDATSQVQKKPIGGFRGGYYIIYGPLFFFLMLTSSLISIIGFLFGFSLASSFAAYHLLEEYQRASAALQTSIEQLKVSTEKVSIWLEYMLLDAEYKLSFRSPRTLDE